MAILRRQISAPVSAVDLASAAALARLSTTIADDSRLNELVGRISARVTSGPAWQKLVQDLSVTTLDTGLGHIAALNGAIRQQLAALVTTDVRTGDGR